MNILFFSDNFPPEVNAAATRVYERACYWVEWGHQVTIIASAPNYPQGKVYKGYKNKWYQVEYIDGIKVIRVKTFMARNSGFLLRILDFMSYMVMASIIGMLQKKPDIIAVTSPQFFAAVGAWFVSFGRRLPFVLEIGDMWPASIVASGAMGQSRVIKFLEKVELFLYRRASQIIVLSAEFKRDMIKRGINANKITIALNGVDLPRYKPMSRNIELEKKYSLQNSFVIGYIGTFGMSHALDSILSAANMLKNNLDIKFIFVGDGAMRQKMLAIKKASGVTNVLIIDPQPKNIIAKYWSLCDIALVSLKNDPIFAGAIPSKIFEIMGMGLPILLSAPPGEASHIVEKNKVGIHVSPEDPNSLVKAILQIKNNSGFIIELSANSRQCAQKYSREQQARIVIDVFSSCLDNI